MLGPIWVLPRDSTLFQIRKYISAILHLDIEGKRCLSLKFKSAMGDRGTFSKPRVRERIFLR